MILVAIKWAHLVPINLFGYLLVRISLTSKALWVEEPSYWKYDRCRSSKGSSSSKLVMLV